MASSSGHKVVLLGASAAGKSSLGTRLAKGLFTERQDSTLAVDFFTHIVELGDGSTVRLEVWDTAGQERYRSVTRVYLRGASAAVVVYDLTDRVCPTLLSPKPKCGTRRARSATAPSRASTSGAPAPPSSSTTSPTGSAPLFCHPSQSVGHGGPGALPLRHARLPQGRQRRRRRLRPHRQGLPHSSVTQAKVWDTAGQERYRSVTRVYLRGASAAVVVYDLTDRVCPTLLSPKPKCGTRRARSATAPSRASTSGAPAPPSSSTTSPTGSAPLFCHPSQSVGHGGPGALPLRHARLPQGRQRRRRRLRPHRQGLPHSSVTQAKVWDTAGQERYRSVTRVYLRGASAAVVVYDLTDRDSFETAAKHVSELRDSGGEAAASMPVALAGNKADLKSQREVPLEEAQKFAHEHDLLFMETSAKTSENVQDIFDALARRLAKADSADSDSIRLGEPDKAAGGSCCSKS